MNENITKAIVDQAWFRNWFDSRFYHLLYANRDEREAVNFIDALIEVLQPATGAQLLDLGCGRGRHSKHLASKGFDVTGIDLSPTSIEFAQQCKQDNLQFFRQDMRVPFGTAAYDFVFSFFTSFGYFEDTRDDHRVIQNISNALRPGGSIVIDYINSPYAEERLKATEFRDIDGVAYQLDRWTDVHHFYKKITIRESLFGEPLTYTEKIRKFSVGDFSNLLHKHGLTLTHVFGDYQLHEYDPHASPRMIFVAKKLY